MQPAVPRLARVTVVVALLSALVVPAAGAAGPDPFGTAARPQPRLSVPFAAPDGYVFTVAPAARDAMRAAAATPLMPSAGLWRVAPATGAALAAQLRRAGTLVAVDANAPRQLRAGDPLRAAQYAFSAIRLPATAPPPRRKILVIDSGLDVTVPDVANRAPGTTVLANAQDVTGADGDTEWHGTAVFSTIAAAVDGVGGEGIFPAATVAMWDASLDPLVPQCAPGGCVDGAQVLRALDWAIRHHYDIVSMSFGALGASYAEYLAVERAIDHGILVVAAAGNESRGTAKQDPFEYPAAYEHVLSVGASTPVGGWAPFSNQSPTNDLLAPGIGVYAAVAAGFSLPQGFTCSPAPTPTEAGWCQVAGTSFATPITAAAAAFVWSQRPHLKAAQVAAALRSGARPAVGQKTHRSSRFGFGRLDVPRALVATAPLTDAFEPNGDIPMVRGTQGFIRKGAILSASRRKRVVFATMDFAEDFSDVYEADVLRKVHRLRIVLRHPGSGRRTDDLTVCVWRQSSRSVLLGSSGGRRLGCSHQHGARTDTLSVRLPKGTRRVFVEIHPTATSTFSGRYTLAVRRA